MNSPMIGLYKSPMNAIYESTCLDLIKELSDNLLQDIPTKESFAAVNGLDKCVEEINFNKNIRDIYKEFHNVESRRGYGVRDNGNKGYRDWTRALEIMKVGFFDQSINDALVMARSIKKEVGTQFYGMLLMDKGKSKTRTIFNPLHPIIAMELREKNNKIDMDEKKWTIAVYSFKDLAEGDFRKDYPAFYNDTDYTQNLGTMIATIDTPSEYVVENKDFEVSIEEDQFVLNYKEIKRLKECGEIIHEE